MNRDRHTPELPSLALPDTPVVVGAREIVRRLQEAGHEAYFVGGAVRNAMLGAAIEDVDIATSARPDEVAALFEKTKAVGAHFGVTLVSLRERDHEVATFRAEGAYVDRRHPSEVRFGALDEDYRRRDFTVNAMYYDPAAGRLVDPAGGREDLARRLLRTVGEPDARFEEDALRLLRAVRFAVRYALAIEPATAAAIARHAPLLDEISAERVADELLRMLTGPRPGEAMRRLGDLALWPHVIPEIEPLRGCPQPPRFHPEGDVFVHTALVLDRLAEHAEGKLSADLALAGLLHDVGKPPTLTRDEEGIHFPEHQRLGAEMAVSICRRLRLPTRTGKTVAALVEQHMRFMDAPRMRRSTLRRFLALPDFDLHLALHRADCLGSHGKLDNYHYLLEKRREFADEDARAAALPPPLITGDDLIGAGFKPGPAFKEILERVRDEQLEGRLATREAALAWLTEHGGRP